MYPEIRPPGRTRAAAPLALALALLCVLAAGCAKDSNTGVSPESVNSNNAPASAPPPTNASPTANTTLSPTTQPAGPSPTEVVRGYYEAGVRKDVAGFKRYLSRASLQRMEDAAKRQGKTLDQLFTEAAGMEARKAPPTFSHERIMGDKATVDIEAEGQPVLTMPLILEDGQWKLVFGQPKSGAARR